MAITEIKTVTQTAPKEVGDDSPAKAEVVEKSDVDVPKLLWDLKKQYIALDVMQKKGLDKLVSESEPVDIDELKAKVSNTIAELEEIIKNA